jgi:hypothetical protein
MTTDSPYRSSPSLLPLCLGLVVTAAVYWPGLSGPFFFDDYINIVLPEGIRLTSLSLDAMLHSMTSGNAGPLGRPISQLSFALNYYFTELAPFPFKLTNLAIHGLNGLLIYAVAHSLLNTTRPSDRPENTRLLAAFVAAAWLLHPIQLTSVLYAVQRMTSLATLFLLAAVLLHLRARRDDPDGRWSLAFMLSAWLVFWPLSVLSKESGVLFLGFVFIYEAIIRRHIHGGIDLFGKFILGATLCAGLALAVYLLTPAGREWLLGSYSLRPFTLTERLLTEPRVLWHYLGMILLPRLNAFAVFHDDILVSTGLLSPWTTLPALLGIVGLGWLVWRNRERNPLLSFAVAWFLVAHSLESSIIGLEIAHEHRNYAGLFGILLLPAVGYRAAAPQKTLRIATSAVVLSFLMFSVLTTALRSHQFADGLRRALMEAEAHPLSTRSSLTAADELMKGIAPKDRNGQWYKLVHEFYERPGLRDPGAKAGLLGLIRLNCLAGVKLDPFWLEELERRFAKTRLPPPDSNLLFSIKEIALHNDQCLKDPEVNRLFRAALSNGMASSESRMFMYVWYSEYLFFRNNDLNAALKALSSAKAIAPTEPHLQMQWDSYIQIDREKNKGRSSG